MDVFQIIGLCVACVAAGFLLAYAHNWAVNQAVAYERQRSEKREERLRSERDNYQKLYQQSSATISKMQMEQANAAGYEDGYRAACKDMDADAVSASVNEAIFNGLQNGKAVRLSVINH